MVAERVHSFAHCVYANPTYSSNIRACSRASRPARSSGALHGLLANCFACNRRRRTHTEKRGRTRSSGEQGLRLLGPGGIDSCASTSPLPLAADSHLSAGSCSYRNFLGCADACGMRSAFGHVVAECSLGIASAFPLARFRIPCMCRNAVYGSRMCSSAICRHLWLTVCGWWMCAMPIPIRGVVAPAAFDCCAFVWLSASSFG